MIRNGEAQGFLLGCVQEDFLFRIIVMYLGIDFLITSHLTPFVIEVNMGLPGGAQEYELTHQVYLGRSSDIFEKIERTSREVYGKPFEDYLHGLPFIESLKPFKIWADGMGPFPSTFHPGLRLEDKWIQYQFIHSIIAMPETMIFDPLHLTEAERFLEQKGTLVLKRRIGRGGRGLQRIKDSHVLLSLKPDPKDCLLQEYIDSHVNGFHFSIRSVAFGGRFMCMYANLSTKSASNHGTLAFVSAGKLFGLVEEDFETKSFNQKSWEAKIWFGENEPSYLRHNLYEDVVAQTTLQLPVSVLHAIRETSIKIERHYEALDLISFPKACFEE
jgi:hypothetical protein